MTDGSSDADGFVTVMTAQDPLHAQMVRDALAHEGIEVQVPGLHHRDMSGGMAYVTLPVRVHVGDADHAKTVVESLGIRLRDETDAEGGRARAATKRRLAAILLIAIAFGFAIPFLWLLLR